MSADRIDPDTKFARLGVDSATAVFLLVELEEWLGVELGAEVVFEHQTITDLARHLSKHHAVAAARGRRA